jgi:prefoldin subunit 5
MFYNITGGEIMTAELELKVKELQEQVHKLQESHDMLKAHYHQFAKATLEVFKEIDKK